MIPAMRVADDYSHPVVNSRRFKQKSKKINRINQIKRYVDTKWQRIV